MDTISFVNKEVMKLWHKWENELKRIENDLKVPLIYDHDDWKKGGLLFIGMNPSFVSDAYQKILGEKFLQEELPNVTIEEFFLWSFYAKIVSEGEKQAYLKKVSYIDRKMRTEYNTFFKPLANISENVGLKDNWEHIDLFFYRVTGQREFTPIVWNEKEQELTDFGRRQVKLSKNLINYTQPRVIVVANAKASEIFYKEYKLDKLDEQKGYYISEIGGRSVPIFLSSMISGGHLDRFSRGRLIWHIKKAIKETTNE